MAPACGPCECNSPTLATDTTCCHAPSVSCGVGNLTADTVDGRTGHTQSLECRNKILNQASEHSHIHTHRDEKRSHPEAYAPPHPTTRHTLSSCPELVHTGMIAPSITPRHHVPICCVPHLQLLTSHAEQHAEHSQ